MIILLHILIFAFTFAIACSAFAYTNQLTNLVATLFLVFIFIFFSSKIQKIICNNVLDSCRRPAISLVLGFQLLFRIVTAFASKMKNYCYYYLANMRLCVYSTCIMSLLFVQTPSWPCLNSSFYVCGFYTVQCMCVSMSISFHLDSFGKAFYIRIFQSHFKLGWLFFVCRSLHTLIQL